MRHDERIIDEEVERIEVLHKLKRVGQKTPKRSTEMDLQKVIAKLKELRSKKDRRARYAQHLQRQEARLGRIARLLRVSPDETKELMELAVEYLSSEGILTKKAVKLSRKRIPSQQDNEVKMFLLKNGLCD